MVNNLRIGLFGGFLIGRENSEKPIVALMLSRSTALLIAR